MDLCVIQYYLMPLCRLRVYMDDMLELSPNTNVETPSTLQIGEVYLGGTPVSNNIVNLTGCLSNIFIKR